MRFEQKKKEALRKLREAKEKGLVDPPIIPLLDLINSLPNYFTTSSCSGRIVLSLMNLGAKKNEHMFWAKWHRKVEWEEFWQKIEEWKEKKPPGILWLKMEPLVLHVCVKDLKSGLKLVKKAISVGFRNSGIFGSDFLYVRILGTDKMEMALGKEGELFCGEECIKKNLEICNFKLEKNFRKIQKLGDFFSIFPK